MTSQIGFCYSSNRAATSPVHILASSFTGNLADRINSKQSAFTSWRSFEWWTEPYSDLWTAPEERKIDIGSMKGEKRKRVRKEDVIYLTGDSENVLESFEEGKAYVLGGLVDHNRHKMLCFNKAVEQGIAHARLPIAEYLPEMLTRKVLTVRPARFEIRSTIEDK